ncbi:MAG: Stp1/IreP family PP2C-type Ser/Thr phosphatase [Acidimicrobiales bacterium]
MTTFRAGSATDVGRVRSNNQDSLLVREGDLFAVADGMGGHQGGEVASALALETLGQAHDDPSTSTLVEAVRSANRAVFEKAGTSPDLKGMGTTLTALADVETTEGKRLGIVNVGDSRLYRARGEHIEQLTEDHSLVASLVRQGRITAEEAESHPQRNILTRALGIDEAVAVDSWEVEPIPGDRFLICSDGLFNEVDEGRMIATLRRFDDPADAARELVRLANEGGGRDNITAVVVDVVSTEGGAVAAPPVEGEEGPGRDPTTQPIVAVGPAVPEEEPGASAATLDPEDEVEPPTRSRRFTWRVAVFVVALLLLVALVIGALGWYARNTFYVVIDDEEVTIFKGRPGGFLWFDPTVEDRTGISMADVPESELPDLEDGVDQATRDDADNYVANLQSQIDQLADETTTSTTTTTTTTTTRPASGTGGGTGGGAADDGTKPAGND